MKSEVRKNQLVMINGVLHFKRIAATIAAKSLRDEGSATASQLAAKSVSAAQKFQSSI